MDEIGGRRIDCIKTFLNNLIFAAFVEQKWKKFNSSKRYLMMTAKLLEYVKT